MKSGIWIETTEARSHEASKISYDFGKAAAQAGLIINGGAATAVIALLAKDKVDPIIFKTVPWCYAVRDRRNRERDHDVLRDDARG